MQWESGTYFPASGYGSDNLRGLISVYGGCGRTSAIAISRPPVLDAGTISLVIGVFVWLSQWTHSRHSLKLTCLLRLTLSVTPSCFGVKIAPLYPPACRERRLKGGVRSSLVIRFASTRCQCPILSPRAEIWIKISAPCAPLSRLWDHNIGYQSQSQAWKLTAKVSKGRVDQMGADRSVVKKKNE